MKPTPESLEPWAPYYDLLHQGVPGDVAFYSEQAKDATGDILEIGVGTGRIALPIAHAGIALTGLDNSPALLALCRYKKKLLKLPPRRLNLVKADMRRFELGQTFSLIYMPYRTFMHALTPDDQRRTLACVHRHLAPGGRFILDTWAAKPSTIAKLLRPPKRPNQIHYVLKEEGLTILHTSTSQIDEFEQLIHEHHLIQEFNNQAQLTNEVSLPLTRTYTTPREMENLLLSTGFKIESVYGDFAGHDLTSNSTDMIWQATAR